MYKIEINKEIIRIVNIFHLFGLWRNEDEVTLLRKLLYFFFQICFAISLLLGGLSTSDKNESILLFATGIANLVVSVKLIYILWKKDEICAFCLDISAYTVADYEEYKKISDKVKNLTKFSSYFMLMVIGAPASLFISSLPVFTGEQRLPVNIWFPLNFENNAIVYWIAYSFMSVGALFAVIGVLLNLVIWYLMMNYAIKYEILGNQMKNIAATKLTTKPTTKPTTIKKRNISDAEKDKLVHEELIGLIESHQNIQKAIDRFKSCFANLFFTQITTSGMCICGSVYAIAFTNTHHENLILLGANVALAIHNIFDIFMLMYFGNEIKLSSDRLSYCLFESNWIEQSKSHKRCIVIMAEVFKEPQELVIGKLYPLNLETFTSILNLAYSMFNILQNLK